VAQRALPSGTVQRRAFFGLLDADGWTLAFIKGMFWFAVILFLLGYVPNAAYKFTVGRTVDLGANLVSPINLCDGSNDGLPCPAPPGAVVPWEPSPLEIALPRPRTDAASILSGTELYLVGGLVDGRPSSSVLTTTTTPKGSFGPWSEGPPLPAERVDAALAMFNGVPYLIGGLDAGGAPTDTVMVGTIDKGKLTGWSEATDLKLPVALSGATAVADAHGVWLIGGRTADGLSAAVYRSANDLAAKPPKLTAWQEHPELALRTADGAANGRADAIGSLVGSHVYLIGGETALGPTGEVLGFEVDEKGEAVPNDKGDYLRLAEGAGNLPEPRMDAAGLTNNGVIYAIGGNDGSGAATVSTYWAVPDAKTGAISEWQSLELDDLPGPRAGAAPVVAGSFALLVGGTDGTTTFIDSFRANLAPAAPFFRLGLVGVTIPGLAIKGEIGIQLGEIAAATVGLVDFALLVALAVILSRPRLRGRILEKLSRGRYRAPREDEYTR
jgi:hypothetical protein